MRNIYIHMKRKKSKSVKGYRWDVELKRMICKMYIDIALQMSNSSFLSMHAQELNQNTAYSFICFGKTKHICSMF